MADKNEDTGAAVAHTVLMSKAASDIINPQGRVLEDDYVAYYESGAEHGLIRPPYDPKRLEILAEENNTLRPCISAMATNIDGTGHEIQRRDGGQMEDSDDEAVQPAEDFFAECAPMMSFKTLRQRIRRNLETIGYGFMEIVRNQLDEVIFCGYLEAKMMRIGRYDDPVPVLVKMVRNGKTEEFTHFTRERRYAQKVGEQLVWFKAFGASRDLNKYTGQWAPSGQRLPAQLRATEVLYFGLEPDITTPYHVPRWITQVPSVLGSRKAEEFNLEYFASGGIPPYLLIVSGGKLAEKAVDSLREALSQKGAQARIQLVEAYSTSGSLDSSSNVQVKVERFGGDRGSDAMFQNYDDDCEMRVRKAFRLPPILIGKSEDYSYASAHASYLVAEAQVFKPERDEFDEVITSTLLPELLGGSRDYVFRSKQISIVDVETQLKAIDMAKATNRVDPEQCVEILGEIAGIKFQVIDIEDVPTAVDFERDPLGNVMRKEPPPLPVPANTAKSEDGKDLVGCALAVIQHQKSLLEGS